MPYYDIVFEGCSAGDDAARKLGFAKIGVMPKDIQFVDLAHGGMKDRDCIVTGPQGNLISAASSGVAGIYIPDCNIDKKLIQTMADNGTALCISLSDLMRAYGLRRSRLLFKMGKLFLYAKKEKVPVSFATMAQNDSMMCSYMQIIEIAKLVGADEEYARKSLRETNKALLARK